MKLTKKQVEEARKNKKGWSVASWARKFKVHHTALLYRLGRLTSKKPK